ncbi:TPA: hypothetical protein EYP66_15790 [Candidatus Poribacteria bacterium]|nr:hypothetical protein [Candidatus Poribacteria bacterium]
MKKFMLACNWDGSLLEVISHYPVYSLYGKKKIDIVGGGRAPAMLPDITDKDCAKYIRCVRDMGIQWNYLLNAPCLGNREFQQGFYNKIVDFIQWLVDIGVSSVTVASPYLLRLIKSHWSDMYVSISKFARINSVQRALFWQSLGANQVTLDLNIYRDFSLLSRIRKTIAIDAVLLVNDACIYQCPFELYHSVISGHASQNENAPYISYCSLYCRYIMAKNLAEIVRSRFIRPNDLSEYTKLGFDRFKIVDRFKNTNWLVNTLKAYSQENYSGNLADILGRFETYAPTNFDESSWHHSMLDFGVYIDNDKLDGVLEYFKQIDCNKFTCDVDCDYCNKIANISVRWINPEKRNDTLKILNQTLKEIDLGRACVPNGGGKL